MNDLDAANFAATDPDEDILDFLLQENARPVQFPPLIPTLPPDGSPPISVEQLDALMTQDVFEPVEEEPAPVDIDNQLDAEGQELEEPNGDVVLDPLERTADYQAATLRIASRPDTWEDFIGNPRAVRLLRRSVTASIAQGNPLAHTILFGQPGVGKTTMAKLIAASAGGRYIETTSTTLTSADEIIRKCFELNCAFKETQKPGTVFIDEIHMLGKKTVSQESIYPLLEDWVFYHNRAGKRVALTPNDTRTIKGSEYRVWPFTCIGATTEPGVLSQALLRRFPIQVEMEPYTEGDIGEIILRSCRRMGLAISEAAAAIMAGYCRLTPARAFGFITLARNQLSSTGEPITTGIVEDTAAEMQLGKLGLTRTDIRALRLLTTRIPKGIGQDELARALGISRRQFTEMMEPYLRQLGFIQTLNRRVITMPGLLYLQSIGEADLDIPAVRSALKVGRISG